MTESAAQIALAFLVGAASALFPVINVELYLVGMGALGGGVLAFVAVAAGIGQTVGKIAYYYIGRGALNVPWLKRRARTPQRWTARVERWRAKAEGRPWWTVGLVAVSSFASIPPFMVVAVLAGTLRMPLASFVLVTFATRTARFALLVYAPGLAMWAL
ncbi:VTT domain-containing protein [Streptomonospora wellingtoniae]|uniref:VTT domain-containing protein n=1 Tax=Streptomonospora wellingtoniae TaxID=3075544 RepID=A0ABU2KZB3_9ACTN|nr:VTT domain-containing protein [Streptomonospora sp. DSM 45055]MDT0304645.1 VTT domain-containing protein [Streptomonospora sp. DSM 45055]